MYLDFLVLGENEIRDFSKVPGVITINRMWGYNNAFRTTTWKKISA
jgi:hypothetical protein